jgi:hypothetical protein
MSASPPASSTSSSQPVFPKPLPPAFTPLRDRLQDWLPRLGRGGPGYQQAHQALLAECERAREFSSDDQRQLIDELARLAAPWTSTDALRHLPQHLHADLVNRARRFADRLHIRRGIPSWVPKAIVAAIGLPVAYSLAQAAWRWAMPGAGSFPSYLERLGREAAYRLENASTLEMAAGLAAGMMAVGWYTMRAARAV